MPVSNARPGEDGVLWLYRSDRPGPGTTAVLMDGSGEPRGALELPPSATVRSSGGETVWNSVRDDFDVPWLVRYRLARGD